MKLFLASALDKMKDQLLAEVGSLQGKKIAYITNPADPYIEKSWPNQWRLKNDKEMLLAFGAELIPVDLRVVQHDALSLALGDSQGVYVSGGKTYYFLQLADASWFTTLISAWVATPGNVYMGSSAWSCIMGKQIKYLEDGREKFALFEGFGMVEATLLPHWWAEWSWEEYQKTLNHFYAEGLSLITLTDQQALVVDEHGMRIVTAASK